MTSADGSQLAGEWTGVNRLWMSPQDDPQESDGSASVTLIGQGQFLAFHYTWTYEGRPQDGLLLVGIENANATAVWTDSWHMSRNLMVCTRDSGREGTISVSGTYAAPPGPDWGWRVAIRLEAAGLVLRMFNIPPGEAEQLAVEAVYARATPSRAPG